MKRLRKLNNQSGFSLAEMLMAVLILLMVSVIVATGMPAARNAYEKTVIGANAQAMLSTAVSALRDELGTAWELVLDNDKAITTDGKSVTYFKADTGTMATITNTGVGGTADYPSIVLKDYVAVESGFIHDNDSKEGVPRALVPDNNTDLFVTYDSIDYANGIVTVNGLKVCKQKDKDTALAELGSLKIRVLSANNA